YMEGYPGSDLTEVAHLSSLKRLHVNSKSVANAQGVSSLERLERLTFAYCSSLLEVNEVARCESLRVLELVHCKKLAQLPAFSSCSLQRLTIENGAALESLRPLLACDQLEEVYLPGTKILDGDISPLLALPRLRK